MKFDRLYQRLKIDEGCKFEIYDDHLGYKTFGIGHLVKETDEEHGWPCGEPVSEERVMQCFRDDTQTAIRECYALYGESYFEDFPDEVQEILMKLKRFRRP